MSDESKLVAASLLLGRSLGSVDLEIGGRAVVAARALTERDTVSAMARLIWLRRYACFLAFSGEYAEAIKALDRAESLATEEGLTGGVALHCFWGALICTLSGELERATRFVDRFAEACAMDRKFERGILHQLRCMTALAKGHVDSALVHGRLAAAMAGPSTPAWTQWAFVLTGIFAMIEAGEHEEAQTNIGKVRDSIRDTCFEVFEIECDLARAYIARRRGEADACHAALRAALKNARA